MKFWHSDYQVVYEDHAVRLLQFSTGESTPVLIIPPQAGHHSFIADYDEGQSLVQSAMNNHKGSVYCIEWKSCTFERRKETIQDLVDQLGEVVNCVLKRCVSKVNNEENRRVHLVGLCQGGWLATIYSSIYTKKVSTLTLAGAPIDTSAGDSVLHPIVKLPKSYFDWVVMLGGGLMRGSMMLSGWKAGNSYEHYVNRYLKEPCKKSDRFYEWYDYTQDIAGAWYLEITDKFFKKNELYKNELVVGDKKIDLHNLKNLAKINVVVGTKDDITPIEQSFNIEKFVEIEKFEIDAGHVGVFMSEKGINKVWNGLFNNLENLNED